MKTKGDKAIYVDAYIAGFPKDTQTLLEQLRTAIMKAAPDAEEVISYQMPAYKYFGMLVYFAGYKNHIGFYPGAAGIETFKKELSIYKGAKGSVQFPLDKPLPTWFQKASKTPFHWPHPTFSRGEELRSF